MSTGSIDAVVRIRSRAIKGDVRVTSRNRGGPFLMHSVVERDDV